MHELPLEYASKSGKGQQELPAAYVQENQTAYAKVPKAKLKADKETGRIILDEQTTLVGVPAIAWEYRLGNRSALEWVIDQYRVKKNEKGEIVSDPNREDDPEYIVRLVGQVVRVSVETVRIVKGLPEKWME